MRSAHDGGEVGAAGEHAHDVADPVDRHLEAEVAHPGDHEIAAGPVVVGEGQASTSGRPVDRADLGQRGEASEEAVEGRHAACGRRRRRWSSHDRTRPALQNVQTAGMVGYAAAMPDGHDGEIAVEFLVEPFVEGKPGPHVTAAFDAFGERGLAVDMGPFASTSHGGLDAVADAVADMLRTTMRGGATSVQVRVAATVGELPTPTLHDALDSILRTAAHEIGTPPEEWDRADKQRVVRILDERGAFLLRGAVDDIADIMGVSRITIYNYLNALERDRDT
ncbi:MAG: helix-turn-helix domain-containing protein [Acidimicrobiales bacterium]